jgi:hypothetical protein
MRNRYNRSGNKMTLSERITVADYEHPIFANWVGKIGLIANCVILFVTLVMVIAFPIIMVTTHADPSSMQKFMVFAFTWMLLGVLLRERGNEPTAFKNVLIRVVLSVAALIIALFQYMLLSSISDFHEGDTAFATGFWVFTMMLFLSIGSFTAPFRAMWRIGRFIRGKIQAKSETP